MPQDLTVIVPGLNKRGAYGEDALMFVSDWLAKNSPAGSDDRLHVHERGMLSYRIFFLRESAVEAMFTLSIYFDPRARARDPHKALWRSGLVVEVVWSEQTSLLQYMFEVLAAVGYHLELGSIMVPAITPVQQRILGTVGYEPHATGIREPENTIISSLFRIDLKTVSPNIQELSQQLDLA